MDSMAAIKQTFFQECEEQLAELEDGLLVIEREEGDLETINAVFRAVHSIKGGAGAFGLDELVRFAHTFETTLDGMRSGKIDISPQIVKLMLRSADILSDLVRISRDGGEMDQARVGLMTEELTRAGGTAPAAPVQAAPAVAQGPEVDEFGFAPTPVTFDFAGDAPQAETPPVDEFGFSPTPVSFDTLVADEAEAGVGQVFEITFRPRADLYAKANDALRLLRELGRLGTMEVACDISELPPLTELDPEGAYLTWKITLSTDADEKAVREIFEFVEFDCDLSIEAKGVGMDEDSAAETVQAILAQVAAEEAAAAAPAAVDQLVAAASSEAQPAAAPRKEPMAANQPPQAAQAQPRSSPARPFASTSTGSTG